MSEAPHVYQNREDGYAFRDMHYCPICNGYYGVPHDQCGVKGGCPIPQGSCACRNHTIMRGEPRQGWHGWIVVRRYR